MSEIVSQMQDSIKDTVEEYDEKIASLESSSTGPYRVEKKKAWKQKEKERRDSIDSDLDGYIYKHINGQCPATTVESDSVKLMCAYHSYYQK